MSRPVVSSHGTGPHSARPYVIGYILSLGLTLTAYAVVTGNHLAYHAIVALIASLALVQFIVQMVCFLHLGNEPKPRWKLVVFGFMLGVVLIIVGGSLWIMANLNYHMTTQQVNTYLNEQSSF
jgi:cytochrome o ubiquinol oxidase operon protein cyoD